MSTIKTFEDLIAWQKARRINKEIYQATNSGKFSVDFGLKDQIRRASVSIMSNIAEGFERNGNREFVNFLSIAKSSAAEVRSQLYIALDLEYITKEQFNTLHANITECSKIISGLFNYLKNSKLKGSKFSDSEVSHKIYETE